MMLRSVRGAIFLGVALALGACSDQSATPPSAPSRAPTANAAPSDRAALEAQINGFINALYAPKEQGAVFSAFAKIKARVASGRTSEAQTSIVAFYKTVLSDWKGGRLEDPNGGQPPSTADALQSLLNSVAQFGGMASPLPSPGALSADATVEIVGSTGATVVAPSGFGGVRFPAGALPEEVIVVVSRIPNPTQPRSGPLPTTLDQYPLFYDFSTFPTVAQFAQPVTVGICTIEVGDAFGPPNQTVANRLQLAHPNPANLSTVELLERAEAPFIHCDGVSLASAEPVRQGDGFGRRALALASTVGSRLASFILPTPAYAVHGGLGGRVSSFSPFGAVDPGGITPLFGQLAVGNFHGCAIVANGQTWCWGSQSFGQLGAGAISNSPSTPVPVFGAPLYTAISSHGSHTCGLLPNGTAQCWGRGGGNLGTVNTAHSPVPVNVLGGPYLEISGGRLTTCALDLSHTASCWGLNQSGEVGNPQFAPPNSSPVPVQVATAVKFRSIEASWQHTCAQPVDIHPATDTYCWGSSGTLGFTGQPNFTTPVLWQNSPKFIRVFGGGTASCGITAVLAAYCWGFNPSGALGDGTTTNQSTPTPVAGNLAFVMIANSTRPNSPLTYTCGLTSSGRAYCWGANDLGQLGNGTTTTSLVPTPVSSNDVFVAIGAGDTFSCAMRADRKVFCWGDNSLGQLGNGVAGGVSLIPVEVPPPF